MLLEHSAQNINCEFHFNSKVHTVEVHFWMKVPSVYAWLVSCVSDTSLCLSVLASCVMHCHIFLRCLCLIFHLRNKKHNDLTLLYLLLRCPFMDFPCRYPQVIIWSQSAGLGWSHSICSYTLPLLLPPSLYPSLFFSLPLNISFSQIWWRNLIREERETGRKEGHSEGRKQSNNEWPWE